MNKNSSRAESIDSSDDHTSDDKTNNANLKKIFIGNLPFSITKHELEDLFGSYGIIIGVNIREDRITGKPKGFGFITYEHEESALDAIKYAHHSSYHGRELTVNLATSRGSNNNTSNINIDRRDLSWKTVPLPSPSEKIKDQRKNDSINNSGYNNSNRSNNKNNNSSNKNNNKNGVKTNTWDQWAGPVVKPSVINK